jgi:hypothetical protein
MSLHLRDAATTKMGPCRRTPKGWRDLRPISALLVVDVGQSYDFLLAP